MPHHDTRPSRGVWRATAGGPPADGVNGTEVVPGGRTVFKVDIDLSLKIKDCPASGLAAVDFRTAGALPGLPTNEVRVKYAADADEALCRALTSMLNEDADLVVKTGRTHSVYDFLFNCSGGLNSRPYPGYGGPSAYYFAVPPDLLQPFTGGSAGAADVAALMAELVIQTATIKGEVAAREKEREIEAAERKRLSDERKRLSDERDARVKRDKELVAERMPPAVTGIWNGTPLNSTGRWVSWDAEAEEFKVGYHWGKDVLDAGRPCVLYRAVVVYRPPSHGFPGEAEVYVRRDGMTGGAKSYSVADEDTDFTSIFHGLQWVQLPAEREGNDV